MTASIIADMTTKTAIAIIPVRELPTGLFPAVTAAAVGITTINTGSSLSRRGIFLPDSKEAQMKSPLP